MSTTIQAPYLYNYTFPEALKDDLDRTIFIETIERLLVDEFCDVVFLEGISGSGKTTILSQFVKKHSKNCLSYFVSGIDKYSQSRECLNLNLFYQLNFYLDLNQDETDVIPDNFIIQLRPHLDKKIRKLRKGENLFFVFDGFQSLTKQGLDIFQEVLSDLPWGKVKFILSGESENLKQILPSLSKLKIKSYPLSYFTIEEIGEYFSKFDLDNSTISEIHFLSHRGLPEILSQIKRNCLERGIDVVLSELRDSKISLFEMDWQKVGNDLQINLLAILSFSEPFYIIGDLIQILNSSESDLKKAIRDTPFLMLKGNTVSFMNQEYLNFSKKKLAEREQETLSLLINYYLKHESEHPSSNQLSNLYLKSKRWGDLLKYLSFETFIKLIEHNNSFSAINNQLDMGLKVSKNLKSNYGDLLRFALPKGSFQEIESVVGLESEIQARISIGDNEGAMSILNNTYLKEDRLKLLALIAKQQKENKLIVDPAIINEINELYNVIDLSLLKGSAIQLASTLLYSCPDLAIDLVEKSVDNTSDNKKLDKAYALLSLNAINANKKTNSSLADLSIIQSKIHNNEERDLVSALSHLVEEYDSTEIIQKAKSLNSSSRKIYLLKNWIKFNLKHENVLEVVEFSIKEIIKSSGEDAPNATILMELSLPLPFAKGKNRLSEIIKLFDTQKAVITTPTRDFIKLQLILAEAERTFEIKSCIDRLLAIYYSVSEIEDIGIRNDCLVQLWLKLKSIDVDDEIEKKEGLKAIAKQDIDQLLDSLLNQTAFHFEITEYIISYSVEFDFDFALNVISKLNVQSRRDYGYRLAVEKYCESTGFLDLNIDFAITCYNAIVNKQVKESALLIIVDVIYGNLHQVAKLEKILPLLPGIKQISDSEYRCYAICRCVIILNKLDKVQLIEQLLDLLNNSWSEIDCL